MSDVDGGSGSVQPDEAGITVLAKADGWRDGLREAAGQPYLWIEVAADPTTARQAWEDNVPTGLPEGDGRPAEPGIYVPFEEVDLGTHTLLVVSSGESGTCPVWVDDLPITTIDVPTENLADVEGQMVRYLGD